MSSDCFLLPIQEGRRYFDTARPRKAGKRSSSSDSLLETYGNAQPVELGESVLCTVKGPHYTFFDVRGLASMDEQDIVTRAVELVELYEGKGIKREDVVINVSMLVCLCLILAVSCFDADKLATSSHFLSFFCGAIVR
jgi:hypothetical protein